jgi:hypothetical protein
MSADGEEWPLLRGSLHDPLRSPVVDPRCFGGSVDRRPTTACSQYRDHRLEALCGRTGCNQLRSKVCIDLCRLGLRWVLHSLCRIASYRYRGLCPLGLCGLCTPTDRREPCDVGFCTLRLRLR